MRILNLTHPLTNAQRGQIEAFTEAKIESVIDRMPQFDTTVSLVEQARTLVDALDLSPAEWQTVPLLVNLPGLAPAAACILAELHGRMGHFPTIIQMRPVEGSKPLRFEVAAIIDLQGEVRNRARQERAKEKSTRPWPTEQGNDC